MSVSSMQATRQESEPSWSNSEGARQRITHEEAQEGVSIFPRFCMVLDLLEAAQADEHAMAWLYLVLRFHHAKHLRWYGRYNYQSKDIAHVQDTLSRRMALAAVYAPHPGARRLARMAMGFLSRGGGMAEQIRLQVLDLMRRHGIREGHRPGIEDRFLEQWHQKLHQNTTPEDIIICEAYLHFLHTGREGDFWHALWERGGISRERLASMPNPITAGPRHLPQLIPDMQRYLWTLKTVHAGADLGFMIEAGKWALERAGDHEAIAWLCEIRDNFGAWWIPGKIAQARARLGGPMRNVYAAERDLLLLDAALEGGFRTAVERIDLASLGGDALVDLVELVLSQVVLSREDGDFASVLHQWQAQVKDAARWGRDWALRANAAAERLRLLLAREARETAELLQGKAEELGRAARIPAPCVVNLSEEVVRGQTGFLLSLLLQRLGPMLRQSAGLGRWNLVSLGARGGSAQGRVRFLPDLGTTQGQPFAEPTVLVVDHLAGTDDLPDGASAVLAAGSIDVLSHVGIRARNQGVLLACGDADVIADLKASFHEGEVLALHIPAGALDGDLRIAAGDRPGPAPQPREPVVARTLPRVERGAAGLLAQADFRAGLVGAKSCRLARLAAAAPSWLATPESLALPFGTLESLLGLADNRPVAQAVARESAQAQEALARGDGPALSLALDLLRRQVADHLVMNPSLQSALQQALVSFGQPVAQLPELWLAVKRVWASKWTERAFLSRTRSGIAEADLCMAVLLQRLIPADYAFVLHTVSPLAVPDATEPTLLGEVVVGLGESLAASTPGRPFGFTVPRSGSAAQARILSYPSKLTGRFAERATPGLMVRSDSNGEDLDDLAGAGLYDSLSTGVVREHPVDYASSALVNDESFRASLIETLRQTALAVETALGGGAQDIEGVVSDGRVTIVQARPQVGL